MLGSACRDSMWQDFTEDPRGLLIPALNLVSFGFHAAEWRHHLPSCRDKRLGIILRASPRPVLHQVPGMLSAEHTLDLCFLSIATVPTQVTIGSHLDAGSFLSLSWLLLVQSLHADQA